MYVTLESFGSKMLAKGFRKMLIFELCAGIEAGPLLRKPNGAALGHHKGAT